MGETVSLYIKNPAFLPLMPVSVLRSGTRDNTDEEMKYSKTTDLAVGDNLISTPLTSEPYNVFILDTDGNDITDAVSIKVTLTGGFYKVSIYSSDAYSNINLKILY
jgi:hypothetical protein